MDNILLSLYPVIFFLVVLFHTGPRLKAVGSGDFLSIRQTGAVQSAACIGVILHHLSQQVTNYGSLDKGLITGFSYAGIFLYLLTIVPHEFLHAICFKDDVYMFHDLKHGMLFMAGPERMSKGHFIFKCLLPSIVLGFIPFIIFWINPKLTVLATLGTLGIASAAGDFYNVRNALRQVPKGARIYQHKYDTFWYMPEK